MKHLVRKPAKAFTGDQFLVILQAEVQGLITKTIEISKEDHEKDLRDMERLYLSEKYASLVVGQSLPRADFSPRYSGPGALWNEQRRLILQEALTHHIYPLMEKELIAKLATEARKVRRNVRIHPLGNLLTCYVCSV